MKTALKLLLLTRSRVNEDNMPAPKRFIYFIDGENLVFRYKSMLESGFIPEPYYPQGNVLYLEDIYLWSRNFTLSFQPNSEVFRAHYYTSVCGDSIKVDSIRETIKTFYVNGPAGSTNCLYPVVMKKIRKKEKGKGVDIKMVVDILSNVYQNAVDTVCIFSGDGDFTPVVEEVIHSGKRVYICAFSSGLSPSLKQCADEVILLDNYFFKAPVT